MCMCVCLSTASQNKGHKTHKTKQRCSQNWVRVRHHSNNRSHTGLFLLQMHVFWVGTLKCPTAFRVPAFTAAYNDVAMWEFPQWTTPRCHIVGWIDSTRFNQYLIPNAMRWESMHCSIVDAHLLPKQVNQHIPPQHKHNSSGNTTRMGYAVCEKHARLGSLWSDKEAPDNITGMLQFSSSSILGGVMEGTGHAQT